MDEDWRKCDKSDQSIMTTTRKAYTSRMFCNLLIGSYAVSDIFYAFGVIVAETNNLNDTKELIIQMELPFMISDTSTYIPVILIQYVILMWSDFMLAVSSLLVVLVSVNVC